MYLFIYIACLSLRVEMWFLYRFTVFSCQVFMLLAISRPDMSALTWLVHHYTERFPYGLIAFYTAWTRLQMTCTRNALHNRSRSKLSWWVLPSWLLVLHVLVCLMDMIHGIARTVTVTHNQLRNDCDRVWGRMVYLIPIAHCPCPLGCHRIRIPSPGLETGSAWGYTLETRTCYRFYHDILPLHWHDMVPYLLLFTASTV